MGEQLDDRIKLLLLGPPDLRAPDGRRLSSVLSQPKRLGLLAYLALSPAPVSRADVVATFWPDADEPRGRNSLSQALFHLRRALGEDVVESVEGDRLQVSPARLWCDARELLLGAHSDAPAAAVGSVELLEGWTVEEAPLRAWLDAQRIRVRERVAQAAPPSRDYDTATSAGAPPSVGARPSRRALPLRWAAAAVVAMTGLAIVTGRLVGGSSTEDLAVLLPRVTVAPGAADLSAQVILDEVLAHLPEREDVRIRPAPSASSVPNFRVQLAAIGAEEDAPRWILEVSVRVTDRAARVVGLLYRSPDLDLPGRASFDVTYGRAEEALVDIPRQIAVGVSEMVERALAGG